jgi:hypothetical protein
MTAQSRGRKVLSLKRLAEQREQQQQLERDLAFNSQSSRANK